MHIILAARFYHNGQTTHVFSLLEELRHQGHQVFLLMTQLDDPLYLERLRQANIPFASTSDPLRLVKCLERFKPQLIHNHSSHTLADIIALGEALHIPTITTIHYLDFKPQELLQEQSAIVVISEEMQKTFHHLQMPTFVVENGVPLPSLNLGIKPWRQEALFLAQATPAKEKNFQLMSASLLTWGWKIKSAGNWRYKGIKNLGWVQDIGPLLRSTNLVIGTGRAVREAMAASCPSFVLGEFSDGLVTPDNGAELEKTNFSGRLSKKPFVPAEAVTHLKTPSPKQFLELGRFGRQYAAKRFSIQDMVKKLEVVYRFTLENYDKGYDKTGK